MLISLFTSEGLGHQWQVKVSTKLIVIKADSSFQSASENHIQLVHTGVGQSSSNSSSVSNSMDV